MAFLSAAGLPPFRRLCYSALLLQLLLSILSPPPAVSAVHAMKAAVTVAKPPPPKKSPPPARKSPPPPLRSPPVRSPPVLKSPPPPPLQSPRPPSTPRPPPQSPAASPPVRAPPPPPLQYTVAFTDFSLINPLMLSGTARQVSGNTLQLTQSAAKLAGAALLRTAVPLTVATPSSSCAALPFSTSFSFQIVSRGADGLALVLSPAAPNLGSPGGNLGWGGPRVPKSASDGPSVAFEFDTFQDRWDRSANHVGVNVNYSMASVAAANVTGMLLGDGGRKYAWVDFNGTAVSIYVSTAATKPAVAVLTTALDLCRIFGGRARNVFVGFSASTGNLTAQAHSVLSWFWNTVPLGSPPPPSPPALPPAPATPPPPPYLGPPLGFDARGPFLQPMGLLTTFRHASTYFTGNARSSSWQPPPSIDWRNKSGVLPSVQDMGSCGGSWAFAAAAAIDSSWAITFGQPAPGVSQQQLIDCADPTQDSCMAGHPGDAFEYVSRLWSTSRGGLVSSTFYPFSGMQSPSCDKAKANQGQYSVVAYEQVQSFGWLGLALAVAAQPVVVNVVGSWPSFYTYRGGFVYDDEGCFSTGLVDHSVLLVGYSLDTTAGKVPYWIIRNSWGTGWGDHGYGLIKIIGGDGICGIQSTPGLYPIIAGLASPCDSGINPCGSGVCSPSEDGTTNECTCPDQFIPVVADLDTGSQTCAPVRVCSYSLYNPCGTGTCLDDGIGGYRCICPAGSASALLATGLPTCIPGDTVMMYTVREGDTCYFIATSYGLTDEQLEAQNPGLSCARLLAAGQVLNVTSTVASRCGLLYSVNPGDSCAAIFSLFKMTASQFRSLNPGVSCFPTDTKPGLVPGQQVCVSNVTGSSLECNGTVVLRPGDTCASLRDAYGLDALSFYRLNPGINCANLLSLYGQEVCIKGAPKVGARRCIVPLFYVVKLGDTCPTILAARFRNNPRLMLRLNPGFVCIQQKLFIGMILCLPWW